ncbi:MAG: mercuric reductase [Candidatus Obscuribacterales bacterium]|jgi:pyruvate/2-oxoglutarate dehydrogenase complex dihydrolipoamide dehydrogenase (E3) component|nr:mercuric reductase [Candidatus Obscuribacterales bacterium]
MAEHYDIAVIGGGKAGKTLAMDMAQSGRKTILIERSMIGGSCINVACIPSKTMFRSAKLAQLMRESESFGLNAVSVNPSMENIRAHKRGIVDAMRNANLAKFQESGLTLLMGEAQFVGQKELSVKTEKRIEKLTADKIYINTGTRPMMPNIPGLNECQPLTSESIMELDSLPEHLLVYGSGYIGIEFAQMFRRFGVKVTVISRSSQILNQEDADISNEILEILKAEGIEFRLSTEIKAAKRVSPTKIDFDLRSNAGGGNQKISGSHILIAVGRVPNTERLNLNIAGIQTNERGFIKVNEKLETTIRNIWALGDVNGGPQFTHVSLDDYRIVAANMRGGNRTTRDRLIPYTVFIDPELGRVGLTEKDALKAGHDILVAKLPFAAIAGARTRGETKGMMKAIIDNRNSKILGVSVLGAEGGELMAVAQMAIKAGLPYTALRDAIFAHPTMAEGFNQLFSPEAIEEISEELETVAAR